MQSLIGLSRLSGFRLKEPRSPEEAGHRQLKVGLIIYLVAALITAGIVYVYLNPPGRTSVALYIADAASIKAGTEVRVAGVQVGRVEAVRLERKSVRVELSVDAGVYLGDQTSADVRMLTVAGGYYVNLISNGSSPLSGNAIPEYRARTPYSLPALLTDLGDKANAIDSAQLGADIDRLATALEANPGAVSTVIDGVKSVAEIANHQHAQLRTILDSTQELLRATISNRTLLVLLLRQTSVLAATLDTYKLGLSNAGVGIRQVIDRLLVLTDFYGSHRDWLIDALQRVNNALNAINTDIPRVIWNLGNFVTNLRAALSPGGLRQAPDIPVLATDMCVPMEGRAC